MERVDYQSLVIQDLINLDNSGELNLNPWYQRRSVWNESQKAYLINTLFERKPIPTLYIRHSIDFEREKSIKEVVDGQQRVRAILGFYKGDFRALNSEIGRKVCYDELSRAQKQQFLMTALPIGYLQGATDADVIDIFARINSVAKSLNSQEKRNAKFSGAFKQFCVAESTKRLAIFRDYNIFTANDISRMTEVQFMSDLVINLKDGLTSYNSPKLDRYYANYDDTFDDADRLSSKLDLIFNVIGELGPDVFKNSIFSRPPVLFSLIMAIEKNIENIELGRITQAILDIDAHYHLEPQDKSESDKEFDAAIASTTQGENQRVTRDNYIKSFIFD